MAVIYPAPGEEKATVQQLLNMADSARDVRVTTDTIPGTGYVAFDVPDELADRWADARSKAVQAIEDLVSKALDEEEEKAPPKKRKYTRKAQPKAAEPEDEAEVESDEEDLEEE